MNMTKEKLRAIPKEDLINIILASRNEHNFRERVNDWFFNRLNELSNEMDLVIGKPPQWNKLNKEYDRLYKLWSVK